MTRNLDQCRKLSFAEKVVDALAVLVGLLAPGLGPHIWAHLAELLVSVASH